jgi:hypothetical protein
VDRLSQSNFDRRHRRNAAVGKLRSAQVASHQKSAPAMPITLTVATDNFSLCHHVLMIAGPLLVGEQFTRKPRPQSAPPRLRDASTAASSAGKLPLMKLTISPIRLTDAPGPAVQSRLNTIDANQPVITAIIAVATPYTRP